MTDQLMERLWPGANPPDAYSMYGARWKAQGFITGCRGPRISYSLTSVFLRFSKTAGFNPGPLTASIRLGSTTSNPLGQPTGGDLTSGTVDADTFTTTNTWYEIVMNTPLLLIQNTRYAIVIHIDTGDTANRIYIGCSSTNFPTYPMYAQGCFWSSTDSGATFPTPDTAYDMYFRVYGEGSNTLQMRLGGIFTGINMGGGRINRRLRLRSHKR